MTLMAEYRAPVKDALFALRHIGELEQLAKTERYAHADLETVTSVLEEQGRFMQEVFAPLNASGDREGLTWTPEGVQTPDLSGPWAHYLGTLEALAAANPEQEGDPAPEPPEREASDGPTSSRSRFAFVRTASRMLRSSARRARHTAGSVLWLAPNRRSNTTRGSFSIGSGVVGLRHESVFA